MEKKPNWTKYLNYLNKSLKNIPNGTSLDAELYSTKGRRGIPSVIRKTGKAKPLIFIFDVIFCKGRFVGGKLLKERRKILRKFKLKEPFSLLPFKKLKSLG